MNEVDIEKGIKEILSERLDVDPEKILRTSYLKDDLGMDSFGAVEVMFEIEDKFGIRVDEKDLLDIKTVQDMLGYIKEKLNNSNSKDH